MQVDDEDGDDPVVKELDVYLSQNLPGTRDAEGRSDGVFLFQYPLRPKWQALDEGWRLDKVAYRPQHQMVELEMVSGLKTPDAGEGSTPFRHKLVSSSVAPKATYAIGMVSGDELHLTPLQAVMQFRPRFDHKDEEDAMRKKNAMAGGREADQENMDDGDDGSDGEQQLSTVQVRVHKRESDKAKEIRRSSHAYMREQEDKEAWKTVEMYAPDAPETLAVRDRLKCDVKDEIDFSVSRRDYLASLNAISKSRDDGVVPAQTSVELSREKLLGMTLEEQVQALMSAAHVLHFDRLLELIPQGMQHANDVLRIIPQTAVLVQGCWVVKSGLIYPEGNNDAVRKCRDSILSHFNQHTRLTANSLRKDLTREVPPALLDSILFQLAIRREGAWEFRLAPDSDFTEAHPDVCKKQAQVLSAMEASLLPGKASKPQQARPGGSKAGGGGSSKTSGDSGGVAASKSGGSGSGGGGSKDAAGEPGPVGGGGGGGGASSSKSGVAGAAVTLFAGATPLDASIKAPAIAIVVERLKKDGVGTMDDVESALSQSDNKKIAEAGAESVLAAMHAAGQIVTIQKGYALKKLPGATPQSEAQRNVAIELFKARSQIKKADLVAAIKEKTGEEPESQAVTTKILKEFAVAKGASWVCKIAQ